MSLIIGIDSSSTELGIGLIQDGTAVCSYSRYVRNSHAEHIHQAMQFILQSNNVTVEDISHCAISAGPGSFTGLRIGIAFLKGLLFGRATPVLPLSSLHCLAAAWPITGTTIVPVFDARRNNVFFARFRSEGSRIVRVSEDSIATIDQMLERCEDDSVYVTDSMGFAGSQVYESIKKQGRTVHAATEYSLQRGLACARQADALRERTDAWIDILHCAPVYLQDSPYLTQRQQQLRHQERQACTT